ncbi:MAG: hypothetical protein QNJ37_04700 [Crocosphaera sp.]|nr:hypothetical protein [Crocosphaera sp.]
MLVASNNLSTIQLNPNSTFEKASSMGSSLTAKRETFDATTTQTHQTINQGKIPFTSQPIDLKINGFTYQLSNNPPPNPLLGGGTKGSGYYYINEETNEIEINTGYDADGLSAVYKTVSPQQKRNKIPPLTAGFQFRQYVVVGDFNFNQSFQGHPSGNFSIYCHRSQYGSIRARLKPGTPLRLRGIDYRVRELAKAQTRDGLGNIVLSVSLQGYWERMGNTLRSHRDPLRGTPLDEPIRVVDLINKSRCGFEYSYKAVLRRVGVPLRGGDVVVKVSRDISSSGTITARQLLEDQQRLLVAGYYVDWSSRSGVILRRWESPKTFYIDKIVADLSKEKSFPAVVIKESGFGAEVSGCYLSHELNNAQLQLDKDPNGGQDGDEYICLIQGDRNPTEPPQELRGAVYYSFDYNKLRSPTLCFDQSQPSKLIERCQLNGSDMEVTEKEYGWVFTSVDVYEYRLDNDGNISYVFKSLADIALNVQWELVKLIEYQYIYDDKTGYYLYKRGAGWQLTRDLQETEDKEAIQLAAAIALESDPTAIVKLQQHLQGYTRFYKRTLTPSELFELEDLGNYYPNLRKKEEDDDNFIPSLYPKVSEREENSLIIRPDPRSTVDEPQPDLIIGAKSRETQKIEINSTSLERFLIWNPVSNQEGTNLDQSAYSESFTQAAGRPELQRRLNRQTGCYNRKKEDKGNEPTYLVGTPGVQPFSTITQTLSYTGAYTIKQAIAACTLDYSIKNSQSSCTMELPIGEPINGLKMGDIVIFEGAKWRVFGYNGSGKIQPDNGYYNNITLSLGKDVDLDLIRKII